MAPQKDDYIQQTGATKGSGTASHLSNLANLTKEQLLETLGVLGGLPVNITNAPYTPIDTGERLGRKPRLTVLFPPCSNELLALINTTHTDEIAGYFNDYFVFWRHTVFGQTGDPLTDLSTQLGGVLDNSLVNGCPTEGELTSSPTAAPAWPSECCVCTPCVRLDGKRNELNLPPHIRGLFIGDVVWLFWLGERLGIFQILGAILDAYATNGTVPISSGSIDPGVQDDLIAIVLEVMIRQMNQWLATRARDRSSLFRTSIGWDSQLGKKMQLDTQSLQRWHVERFIAGTERAKVIGIHMPPIGPQTEWTDAELAAGEKDYKAMPPMVAWESKRGPFPLLAIAPQGFYKWLAADRGSFLCHREWFVQRLTSRPKHGIRLVFSGHIHRAGLLFTSPATLSIPKKGWMLPEKYNVLKVHSVSPKSSEWNQIVYAQATSPLYVNTTSTGPRGVRNLRGDEEYTESPGFTLVRLVNDGRVTDIWQGNEPPRLGVQPTWQRGGREWDDRRLP